MKLEPKPVNDFHEFIDAYHGRCKAVVPEIEGVAGKWLLEDLIPGLSDFDTRLIFSNLVRAEDWCRISSEIGKVHHDLVREYPHWARNLEHLPGVNLTWEELGDPGCYYPEFSQWTFYHGPVERLKNTRSLREGHLWCEQDELFHWKKIALFYGPYDRAIDPPINLGRFRDKYALHSRLLHYFAPPVHSAVCLKRKVSSPGKLEALRAAGNLFGVPEMIDKVFAIVDSHYEIERYYREHEMVGLERRLLSCLVTVVEALAEETKLFDCPCPSDPQKLGDAVRRAPSPVSYSDFFDCVKFSRLMKGRLWFYSQEVEWFDSPPLILNELRRLRSNFFLRPLEIFSRVVFGEWVEADMTLQRLVAEGVFHPQEVGAFRRFHDLADPQTVPADTRKQARRISEHYDEFYLALEKLAQIIRSQ
jgi:hypothetical protein